MEKTEAFLDHLPKKTPAVAVGLVAVLLALTTCIITLFVVGKEEIKQGISWAEQHHEAQVSEGNKNYSEVLTSVLNLVRANSEQIVELSSALGVTQQQNIILTDKVSTLERKVTIIESSLNDCESKLRKCEGK